MDRTVLVTGATGYIARHIVHQLLEAGWRVRGSVRSKARAAEARKAIGAALSDPAAIDRLDLVELDLSKDAGWEEAAAGCRALLHTASPFPMEQPRNAEEVTRPAVDGTLRAMKAAAAVTVPLVVLTSSIAAIQYAGFPATKPVYTEADWTEAGDTRLSAYTRSKTLAERAAWDFAGRGGGSPALVAINPGLVFGRPLGSDYGTSLAVLERILRAKDPALPPICFPIVDVRDVAAMHVAALSRPAAAGKRFIGSAGEASFAELARMLAQAFPERRLVTREAPQFLIRMIGLFDRSIATIRPDLGRRVRVSNAAASEVLGIEFRDMTGTVVDSARYLIETGRL